MLLGRDQQIAVLRHPPSAQCLEPRAYGVRERRAVEVQAKLLTDEIEADVVKTETQSSVARSIASREEEVRARMNEESRKGREHFNAADAKTRKELVRAWVASREGKLMLRRMKLEAATVVEEDIVANTELVWYLGQFVFGRMNSSRASA